ncbi:MAG: (d)CMP kinase [Bacteroidota bacterium]
MNNEQSRMNGLAKNSKIIIAIDGFSACGKSTLAKDLGKILGYAYIDTGAMYRAVTLYFLENQVELKDEKEVATALGQIQIEFVNRDGQNRTFLNGKDVEEEIREMYVSQSVSPVAAVSAVRRALVAQQQQMGKKKGVILDGRDIGTVVFPEAELKLFLTASPTVRAKRRQDELVAKGRSVDFEAVKANLIERDNIDSNRADSPLKQAEDAVVIDNSNLTKKEQLAMVCALVEERMKRKDKSVSA